MIGALIGWASLELPSLGSRTDVGNNDRSAERYFSKCDEARAAGVAPMYAGDPGYRSGLDGDGDGIACEPYRGNWP